MTAPTPTPSPLSPPQWVFQWSDIIAGLGTVLLTLFLVILYKRQQNQLAAQHAAELQVTDYDWTGDKVTVFITNFGNGVARQLRFTTLVQVDTGDHREYVIRSNIMTRTDKNGNRPNAIQPGEEDIPFEGKSRIGRPAPKGFKGDWVSIDFSNFIRRLKNRGSTQVKFLHIVEGVQLSQKKVSEPIYMTTRGVNPQDFNQHHSLENPPSVTRYGYDHTFDYFFLNSSKDWLKDRLYFARMRLINWIIPKLRFRHRPLDASGKKRVKRVLLRRDMAYYFRRLKNSILSIHSSIKAKIQR